MKVLTNTGIGNELLCALNQAGYALLTAKSRSELVDMAAADVKRQVHCIDIIVAEIKRGDDHLPEYLRLIDFRKSLLVIYSGRDHGSAMLRRDILLRGDADACVDKAPDEILRAIKDLPKEPRPPRPDICVSTGRTELNRAPKLPITIEGHALYVGGKPLYKEKCDIALIGALLVSSPRELKTRQQLAKKAGISETSVYGRIAALRDSLRHSVSPKTALCIQTKGSAYVYMPPQP